MTMYDFACILGNDAQWRREQQRGNFQMRDQLQCRMRRDTMIFRQKFRGTTTIKPGSTLYEPSFVKELRDPHCRCNLRAIVSQELLFNLEPFKKVGRRHNKQASTQVNVCFKRHCLPQLCSYIARQPYSMLSSLALTQLPQQLVCTMYVHCVAKYTQFSLFMM